MLAVEVPEKKVTARILRKTYFDIPSSAILPGFCRYKQHLKAGFIGSLTQHDVMFCSQTFSRATVALRTNLGFLADFLSRIKQKLPSSVTWP